MFASSAYAAPPVLLGTADSFGVLGGSTITNTGNSVINGDLGLHPGTAVTGFPPGTVNGAQHVNNAVAQQAKTDLVTAYNDAAGRPLNATAASDLGGQTLTPGVYRTGSVPSLGLTGNVTLNAQGDPNAVFIFQVASTLTTATDSSVSLINGAQACNVYWQVGSSATLGTRTAFKGTIMALTSITVNNGAAIEGRLLARNGAVTLDNDTVTRPTCAADTGDDTGDGDGGSDDGSGDDGDSDDGDSDDGDSDDGDSDDGGDGTNDSTGPVVRIRFPRRVVRNPRPRDCVRGNFRATVRLRDRSGIRTVRVYLDGKRVKRTSRTRFSLRIKVRGLRVGPHRVTVVAFDREGNRSTTRRKFRRCALALPAPRFTG